VLLTGATGFLGAYLLRELLEHTEAEVHCLLRRTESPEAGARRLRGALEKHGLWDDALASRIQPLPGDLSLPLLGLASERFDALAASLDAVYHNGAWVNFLYPYATLKAANVGGTQEVLRLAARSRPKPVHFVSTISVFAAAAPDGVVAEVDDTGDPARLLGGYAQSKWVAERLIQRARERGLPVTIHRPGRITGDVHGGTWSDGALTLQGLSALLELERIPRLPADAPLDLVPVDYVARAIVRLSLAPRSLGRAFHLVNPRPVTWGALIERLRARGYALRELEPEAWAREAYRSARRAPAGFLHALLPFVPAGVIEELERPDPTAPPGAPAAHAGPTLRLCCENALAGLAGSGVDCPAGVELLDAYLSSAIRSGALPPPPAVSTSA
jgi:thioester reductase-like protein